MSMPNTCRIDTFMSGSPVGSWVAILFILPPVPGARQDPFGFGRPAPPPPQTGRNIPPKRIPPPESAPAHGLQIIVGLNDVPQPVLAGAIAAVGVGMMTFHQNLDPRLDIRGARARFQPEHVERLAFGIAHDAALGCIALRLEPRSARVLEKSERIGREELPVAVRRRSRGGALAVDADLPGRTVAGNGLLLISGDRVFAHSGKKIVGMIVVAHVMKAEAPIFARAQAPLGGAMGGVLAATGPIAGRIAQLRAAVLCGLDPDTVEQRRVELHGYRLCETDAVTRKRLNGYGRLLRRGGTRNHPSLCSGRGQNRPLTGQIPPLKPKPCDFPTSSHES